MLARPHRLRSAADIARTYRRGTYGGSSGVLSVKAAPSGRAQARAVVVVAKKVHKRAVVRNRIRRRLIEIYRESLGTVQPGYDIVISAHSDVSGLPPADLKHHLLSALERAGAIKH